MTREEAINFLIKTPVKFANMVGFTEMGKLHNYWMRKMILDDKDDTLQAARNTYKTTTVSVVIALIMIMLPNMRILFIRKTDSDVKEVIRQVKNILQSKYTQYFVRVIYGVELKLVVSNLTELSTNLTTDIKGSNQLVGIGIGSSITGKHFDYIFTDDIVNINDRVSKAERERTKLIYQELQNIKTHGGKIFNTGTPWHKDDAFSKMPPAEKYDCYHPDIRKIIGAKKLEALKRDMIPSLFAANYELRHIASEDVIFENAQTGADIANIYDARECHIDAGYGGGDATAFTMCNKKNGKYYVLGKLWWKHVDDVLDTIIGIRQTYNAGVIRCERNADKGYLAKELKQKGERVSMYHENMNKYLKIVTYLKKIWADVIFVEGTDDDYINMILDFNENAEHDDAPDGLACIARRLWKKKENNEGGGDDVYNIYLQ